MRKTLKWALLLLTVAWCFFIWHFSLADADVSSVSSGRVTDTLNAALESLRASYRLPHDFVRKAAHFTEFLVLGVLLSVTLIAFRAKSISFVALPSVFAVAAIDEFLQIFSPGRAAAFPDVLLDTAGGVCGMLIVIGFAALFQRRGETRKSENPEKNS